MASVLKKLQKATFTLFTFYWVSIAGGLNYHLAGHVPMCEHDSVYIS